jgi:hypothetical protein
VLRTPAEGADTVLWLATSARPAVLDGHLFLDRRPRPFDRIPATRLSRTDRASLWSAIVALSGGPDPLG